MYINVVSFVAMKPIFYSQIENFFYNYSLEKALI